MSDILVFIEHRNCVLNKTSLEAIAAAQSIAKDLGLKASAVIPCDKDCSLAQDISGYDLEKVIVVNISAISILVGLVPDIFSVKLNNLLSRPVFVMAPAIKKPPSNNQITLLAKVVTYRSIFSGAELRFGFPNV